MARLPEACHLACIDTVFHESIADAAAVYGGPRRWWDSGLRRRGFHGLSHHDASQRAATVIGRPVSELGLITVHCGGGVSAAAVQGGRSVDTTMGLTPMEGPLMATRSGSVDPGLLAHVQRAEGLDADGLERILTHESGLLGLSGTTGSEQRLREIRDADERADLAVSSYEHRLRASVASMMPALDRLDGLVLTGDVLESDAELRAALCARLGFADVRLNAAANRRWSSSDDDADVSASDSRVAVVVVRADEESFIARLAIRRCARSQKM